MKQFPVVALFVSVFVAVAYFWLSITCYPSLAKQSQLRHVVILKFKQSATKEQIAQIEHGFSGLKSKIPQVANIEWGTNVSTENLANGFTHCFLVTFKNSADRDAYLVHTEHKKFVEVLLPATARATASHRIPL